MRVSGGWRQPPGREDCRLIAARDGALVLIVCSGFGLAGFTEKPVEKRHLKSSREGCASCLFLQ
jgi:hypothetical protein